MTAALRTDLDGSVALVTGGTRGIGLEVARGLGRAGATVVLVGQDGGRVERAVADLLLEDVDATGRAVDVADPSAVAVLADSLGPLAAVDVLVNAAAVMSERTAKTLRTSPQ